MGGERALRVAVFGCGFWSRFQIAGWREVPGVEVVALYNRTRSKAEAVGGQFGIKAVYDDPEKLLDREPVDVVDVITDVDTHARFVSLAAARRLPVICQKPMGPTLAAAREMVAACRAAGVPFFVHENWRWQAPIRALKAVLATGRIGRVYRARLDFSNGFPVFRNQPFLRELEQFLLTDIGSHILDTARCLFGEASSLYCQTRRMHADIRGEDAATVLMRMGEDVSVVCTMSYVENYYEHDRFPETYGFVEGDKGTLELGPDYWIRLTTKDGTRSTRCPPPRYAWADPAYDLVQASIVPCHANLAGALRGEGPAETTGEDNLKTMELVFGAYESAASGKVLQLTEGGR